MDLSLGEFIKILSLMPHLEDLEIECQICDESKFEMGDPVHIIRLKKLTISQVFTGAEKLFRSPGIPASENAFVTSSARAWNHYKFFLLY